MPNHSTLDVTSINVDSAREKPQSSDYGYVAQMAHSLYSKGTIKPFSTLNASEISQSEIARKAK